MDDAAILDLFFTRSESAIVELDAKYGPLFHTLAYNILSATGTQRSASTTRTWARGTPSRRSARNGSRRTYAA